MVEQDAQVANEVQEPQPVPVFHIDESWFETAGRSLQDMIDGRVVSRQQDLGSTGKRRKKRPSVSMAELAKIEGFVNPELPILEAIFRLLLVHENKPMDVEQISQELAERGIGILDARIVRPETLTRILDTDSYYRLKRVTIR